jgi:hypothetical protein
MLQVCIDYAEQVRISLRPAVNHRAGKPTLATALEYPNPGISHRACACYIGRAVRASVVYDYEFATDWGVLDRRTQTIQKNRNITRFIEGWNNKG